MQQHHNRYVISNIMYDTAERLRKDENVFDIVEHDDDDGFYQLFWSTKDMKPHCNCDRCRIERRAKEHNTNIALKSKIEKYGLEK